jgi:hypothetical protein
VKAVVSQVNALAREIGPQKLRLEIAFKGLRGRVVGLIDLAQTVKEAPSPGWAERLRMALTAVSAERDRVARELVSIKSWFGQVHLVYAQFETPVPDGIDSASLEQIWAGAEGFLAEVAEMVQQCSALLPAG